MTQDLLLACANVQGMRVDLTPAFRVQLIRKTSSNNQLTTKCTDKNCQTLTSESDGETPFAKSLPASGPLPYWGRKSESCCCQVAQHEEQELLSTHC